MNILEYLDSLSLPDNLYPATCVAICFLALFLYNHTKEPK